MPTSTYDLIASSVLSSNAASVTFSSLPSSYRDLVLICTARSTRVNTVDYLLFKLNNDTASNYSRIYMDGTGTTTSSYYDTISVGTIDFMPAANSTAGVFGIGRMQVMDYSATDKHKTMLIRTDLAERATFAQVTRWAKTEAINEIVFTMENGSIASGSSFYLYGIVS